MAVEDRWQRLNEIWQSALQLEPDRRAAFVRQACAGEESLRSEVESLLGYDENAGDFLEPPEPPQDSVLTGRSLADFQVLDKLGEGGMGVVYKARDVRLKRLVSIKLLGRRQLADAERRRRFVQEARAASALNHPNIVTIYDIVHENGRDVIVMEYVPGKTLDQVIPRTGLALDHVLKYAVQIADGLAAAHAAGIVHRDIKPGNLIVNEAGLVKVVDFGLAKLSEPLSAGEASTDTAKSETAEGKILGTAAYMSPEQAEGKKVDARSDIFSFGAVLYEMATGRRAFTADTAAATLAAVIKEQPKPVSEVAPEAPRDLEKLISRCLQKQPDRRWQSMADLRVALSELREESESGARQAAISPAQRRSRWRWAALALLTLVIAGAWLLWRYGARRPPLKPILTSKDVIVLADFVNSTGDPVFDGTLREALANQIENSNLLRAMSPGQIRLLLADMKRPSDTRITADVANEICLRAGEKATLAGSIAALGGTYVLTLKATNCKTGETLASHVVEAAGKEKVLGALAQAVDGIREKLGESLPNIQRTADVGGTTASLEAYQAYAMGLFQFGQGQYAAGIPHLDRAIQLDPNLAIAYTQEAIRYTTLRQNNRARELFRQGFERRTHASERERLWIEGRYYQAEGNLDRARPVFEEFLRLYPNYFLGFNALGNIYRQFGDFEKALPMYREVIRLAPWASLGYFQLAAALIKLGRFEEAHAVAQMPAMKRLNPPDIRRLLLALNYLEGDQAAAQGAVNALEGTEFEVNSLDVQQAYVFAVGKFRSAEALQAKAEQAARRQNLGAAALAMKLGAAAWKANVGLCSDVEATVTPGLLKADLSEAPRAIAAIATCGGTAKAQRLTDGMARLGASGQVWESAQLPLIRARILLARGKPAEAVAALEPARVFERALPGIILARGEAHLRSNKPLEAAAEFRKILNVKANLLTSDYNAAQVGLARALAASGDTAGARKGYKAFFDVWKSADPGIPLLVAARKEYAALR